MPQTVEHFQICKLLQIPRGIIVITKKHLVDAELLSLVEVETRELVKGSRLESAPVVAVDSVSGEGLDKLKTTLLDEIRMVSGMGSRLGSPNHVFRLPIDRVFTIRGFGTIVTGTPYAGSLKKGEEVTVYPADKRSQSEGHRDLQRDDGLGPGRSASGAQPERPAEGRTGPWNDRLGDQHAFPLPYAGCRRSPVRRVSWSLETARRHTLSPWKRRTHRPDLSSGRRRNPPWRVAACTAKAWKAPLSAVPRIASSYAAIPRLPP